MNTYTSDVQLIVVIVYMHYAVPVVSETAAMHSFLLNSVQGQETDRMVAARKGCKEKANMNIANKVTLCTLCFVCVNPDTKTLGTRLHLPLMYMPPRNYWSMWD